VPVLDAYSSRLVSGRSLYDAGQMVARSPSLAALAAGPVLRVNPFLLSRLGVSDGDRVRVSSSRRSVILEIAGDPDVPRGAAVLPFNRPGEGAADLIDASQPLTEVRVERLGDGEVADG
jgi:anaerobic selenocysteine-containing dehydrogenase